MRRYGTILIKREHCLRLMVIAAITIISIQSSLLSAAQLSDLYGPLVRPDQRILTLQGQYYTLWQNGHHGSASFDSFDSRPHTESLANELRFAPAKGWDITFGYQYAFPAHDNRPTENNSDVTTSYQRYYIEGLHDFMFNARYRHLNGEYYLDVLEKRHKTSWDFATSQTLAPIFFNYIQSHYEDIALGARFIHGDGQAQAALFEKPLLTAGQLNSEWELRYRNGKLNRNGFFYLADDQYRSYVHRTHEHFLPGILLRYGLRDNAQVEGGVTYTSPVRYIYDFRQYKESGLTNFISGNYTLDNSLQVPLKAVYRPTQNWDISTGINYAYAHQNLDYWEKAENGTLTQYPSKKLDYHNLKPRLDLTFVTSPDHEVTAADFCSLEDKQLAGGQWKTLFYILKDITILNKNAANGTQNIVDPYNVYLYPVENYVAGTEYAAFFSGNTALTPSNIGPQDYVQAGAAFSYGINDRLEIGVGGGYRSESHLHQFSVNDRSDRYYIFKPYYYTDAAVKYRLTKNSQLSFHLHFVPDYKTVLNASNSPEIFNARSRYLEAGIVFKKSF